MPIFRDGHKVISDGALVAITLMIAESDPKEKDIMTTMVIIPVYISRESPAEIEGGEGDKESGETVFKIIKMNVIFLPFVSYIVIERNEIQRGM